MKQSKSTQVASSQNTQGRTFTPRNFYCSPPARDPAMLARLHSVLDHDRRKYELKQKRKARWLRLFKILTLRRH